MKPASGETISRAPGGSRGCVAQSQRVKYRCQRPGRSSADTGVIKRVNTVRAALCATKRAMPGTTRSIQGVGQMPADEKMFCMSMLRCTAFEIVSLEQAIAIADLPGRCNAVRRPPVSRSQSNYAAFCESLTLLPSTPATCFLSMKWCWPSELSVLVSFILRLRPCRRCRRACLRNRRFPCVPGCPCFGLLLLLVWRALCRCAPSFRLQNRLPALLFLDLPDEEPVRGRPIDQQRMTLRWPAERQ